MIFHKKTSFLKCLNFTDILTRFSLFFFPRRGYLNACIGEIRYGKTQDSMIDITNRPAEKYLVEKGCNLNYCHKPDPICKNNGRCTPGTNNDVNCDCLWTGFTGDYCTERKIYLITNILN